MSIISQYSYVFRIQVPKQTLKKDGRFDYGYFLQNNLIKPIKGICLEVFN
jgi:hypothetical protein